jgi:predicted aconitase
METERVHVVLLSRQKNTPSRCQLYVTCAIAIVMLIMYSGKVDIIQKKFVDLTLELCVLIQASINSLSSKNMHNVKPLKES